MLEQKIRKKWFEYLPYLMGLGLLGLFCITRFWRVITIPSGLHIDEMGMAYDAWSLSEYGVDRYLESWPVYLKNFGGGQSSLYCFLCAILFRIFGYSVLLVRLPGIIASLLTVIFGVLLADKMFPDKKYLPFLAGIILVLCPYFIMASRFGLDCNLMLGFSTLFLYVFITAVERGRYIWYALAGITGGIVLYTYVISYMVLPLFLFFCLLSIIWTKKFSIRHWIVMAILMGVFAFPLILVQIVNMFELPQMTLGIFTITRLPQYRVSEIGIPKWSNLLCALESIFIGDPLNYNSAPGYYNMFFLTIPLFVLGLIYNIGKIFYSLKMNTFQVRTVVFLWFLSMLCIGSMVEITSNKINGIFCVVALLTIDGVYVLMQALKKYQNIIVLVIGMVYGVLFLRFGNYYYTGEYIAENYPLSYFDVTVSEAIAFLETNPQYQGNGTCMAQSGICFALSSLQSPRELGVIDSVGVYNEYYYTGGLGLIEEGYNYIVTDIYVEYAQELRSLGYMEKKYPNYSLFYKEWYK